jgi:hypothetical protein
MKSTLTLELLVCSLEGMLPDCTQLCDGVEAKIAGVKVNRCYAHELTPQRRDTRGI